MKTISKQTRLAFGLVGGIALLVGCAGGGDDSSSFAPAPSASAGYSSGEGLAVQNHHYGVCQPAATAPRFSSGSCDPSAGDARAEVASAMVAGLADLSLEDTGDVHSSPGVTDTLLTASAPGLLSAGVVSSSASSSTSGVNAAASVAGLNLSVLGIGITADAVDTRASARCGVASGATIITNLKIAGVHVDVTAAPNVTIQVGLLLKVVLNEQVAIANGIAVRAIHVTALDGSADVTIALSQVSTTASCCSIAPDSGTSDSGTSNDGGITIVIPDLDGGILPPIIDPLFDGGVLPPIIDPLFDGGVLPPIIDPLFDGGVLPPITLDGSVLPPIPDPGTDGGYHFPPPNDAGTADAGPPVPGTPCDDEHGCGPQMTCIPVFL
jgi:hypothetical protein